jgi:hypothetical protein
MCLPEDSGSFGGSVAVVVEEERSEKWVAADLSHCGRRAASEYDARLLWCTRSDCHSDLLENHGEEQAFIHVFKHLGQKSRPTCGAGLQACFEYA